ncbi:MAG: sulfotransferase [Pseudomonadota bacterium]|nr:sulfotransferase [Pseudomonadota bacterium]
MWVPPEQKKIRVLGIVTKCLLLPVIVMILIIHRLAFSIDVILFPRLKHVEVSKPLFIVGLPRSGTTTVHRMMASHSEQFTSMPLWELIFAPALCQKYLFSGASKIDAALGGPVQKILNWAQDRLISSFDDIHPTRLTDPEEDYLGLLPFDGCFLRFLVFPYAKNTWAIGDFSSLPLAKKQRLLTAYRGLVKRHLAFRGEEFRLLSKNPSFTTWVSDLAEEFPDAEFIGTHRDLAKVVPSQLSSIDGGLRFFGCTAKDPWIIAQFSELLTDYQERLTAYKHDLGLRYADVDFQLLVSSPEKVIEDIYQQLQIPPRNEEDATHLRQLLLASRSYKSKHAYSLNEFGLQPTDLGRGSATCPSKG